MALLVLLNVGLGVYACLRDTPAPLTSKSSPALSKQTQTENTPDSECGDNCHSCVCCAAIIVVEHFHYESALPVAAEATTPVFTAPNDPEPHRMKRPPRA